MRQLTDPFVICNGQFDGPVLVTGAAGCIGAWTVAILTRSGIPCIAADVSMSQDRVGLILGEAETASLTWCVADITDGPGMAELVKARGVTAIIHLAGLQVPFCAADPALGARVNVEGTVNILSAAREAGIGRLAYASSTAAHAFPPGQGFKETLYGAYKTANEQTACVFWKDWQVPSIGIRPNVVYGLGRDQGMSSLTTAAIHAAVLGVPFEVPYIGPYSWLYAGEAAAAFIAAVSRPGRNADVYDLNGRCVTVERGIEILKSLVPSAEIFAAGGPFPFPPDLDEGLIRADLPEFPRVSVEDGIESTLRAFQLLAGEARLPPLPV